jgi:ABC-2 type transport system ATP-binding protein
MKDVPANAIVTTGLTKRYDRYLALRDVDLEVPQGAFYGLIGPNGAGKTTLIQLLAAAQEPSFGEILIHGERLSTERPQPHLKRQMGYLPDDFPVYEDLNVWDYLDYFARLYQLRGKARHRRIQEVLELVNLSHKRHSPTSQLSRGMKQRLGLARTILHDPSILLLDEPVSGLDPIARQEFREVMTILGNLGTTIMISSHVLSDLAELCSAIGIMEMGCLVESTSLEDLYQRFSRRWVEVRLLPDAHVPSLYRILTQTPWVKEIQEMTLGNPALGDELLGVRFHHQGQEDALADLLRQLMAAGLPIVEFRPLQENLEDIFLKIGHTQAS